MLKYSGLYNTITAAVRFNKIFIKKKCCLYTVRFGISKLFKD